MNYYQRYQRAVVEAELLLKDIKEKRMCGNGNVEIKGVYGGSAVPQKGSKWVILGEVYAVRATGQEYLAGNGFDPNARYISLYRLKPDGNYSDSRAPSHVITHKRFAELAKPFEALTERFVSASTLLNSEPCDIGVEFILQALGGGPTKTLFGNLRMLVTRTGLSNSYPCKWWYDKYKAIRGHFPPTGWLLFAARALDLVPKSSNGPDRATLLRLLGIPAE